jgi:hypothetical protein
VLAAAAMPSVSGADAELPGVRLDSAPCARVSGRFHPPPAEPPTFPCQPLQRGGRENCELAGVAAAVPTCQPGNPDKRPRPSGWDETPPLVGRHIAIGTIATVTFAPRLGGRVRRGRRGGVLPVFSVAGRPPS